MVPIKPGTASRLGLRKPTGAYRYRDGTLVIRDEMIVWVDRVLAGSRFRLAPFQRHYLNQMLEAKRL